MATIGVFLMSLIFVFWPMMAKIAVLLNVTSDTTNLSTDILKLPDVMQGIKRIR